MNKTKRGSPAKKKKESKATVEDTDTSNVAANNANDNSGDEDMDMYQEPIKKKVVPENQLKLDRASKILKTAS